MGAARYDARVSPEGSPAGRIRAAIFDWDGTLADSLGLFFGANADVMRELGVPFDEAAYREHYTADWRTAYRRLGVPEHRLDEASARWREHFDRRSGETVPLPGATESLARLHEAGIVLGIVTAGDRAVVEPQMTAFGLDPIVSAAVFRDDLAVTKPDPAPLRRALDLLGLADEVNAITFVGDAPDDMRMARAVGCHAVAVESMLGDAAALRAAGADEVVSSVAAWVDHVLGPAGAAPAGASRSSAKTPSGRARPPT
jgi:HAD superfamily hydrolase (TIGR01509 family)